jgi:acyl dehydratase
MSMRFADLTPGRTITTGTCVLSQSGILEFARCYDPQWFHTDPVRAAHGRWQGLIASGWHTCVVAMQLVVAAVLHDSESFGSPGIEDLKWLEPVRPGDELRVILAVLESSVSASGRTGIIRWRWDVLNQADKIVLTLVATSLFDLASSRG